MRKWITWVILGTCVVVLGLILFVFYRLSIYPKIDQAMLRSAEAAINSGITIEDAQSDLVSLQGKVEKETGQKNNPQSYTSPYLDVKTISVGADDNFLYYKVKYWGKIPLNTEKIGDDVIRGNMMKLHITDEQGKEQAILVMSYGWVPFNLSGFETYYYYSPTGIEEPEDKRFSSQGRDSKMFGGPGTDYLIGAFPMKKLGLKLGQTMYMNFLGEAKSKKYTHASIDALRGKGKMAGFITWDIGSNQYQINDNFYK